ASDESSNNEGKPRAGENREEISGTVTVEEMAAYEEEGKNPFGEAIAAGELTDSDFQEYIHRMSHQKVKAAEKWGTFYEINPTRIGWLLVGLDKASDLEHKQTYATILKK